LSWVSIAFLLRFERTALEVLEGALFKTEFEWAALEVLEGALFKTEFEWTALEVLEGALFKTEVNLLHNLASRLYSCTDHWKYDAGNLIAFVTGRMRTYLREVVLSLATRRWSCLTSDGSSFNRSGIDLRKTRRSRSVKTLKVLTCAIKSSKYRAAGEWPSCVLVFAAKHTRR